MWTDAFGRVVEVDEPDPTSGSLTGSGANYTCSSYDLLDNLTATTQGSQTRSYSYDGLSRVTSAQTPESGTTSFYYTNSSGGLCSGDPGAVCRRTDGRGITTTYSYDTLDRLTSKTYSGGTTPSVYLSYDESGFTINGTAYTLVNTKGRLSHAYVIDTDGVTRIARTIYSYDPVGRAADTWQCTAYNCGSATFWHQKFIRDLAGDVSAWMFDPTNQNVANPQLTYSVNAVQQVTQITSTYNDTYHPPTLFQNITYTPFGALASLQNGCVGSCTPRQETYTYNKRLQPLLIELGTAGSPAANSCLVYNYYSGYSFPSSPTCASPTATGNNNGNVLGYFYQDASTPSYQHKDVYTYDALNRLTNSTATAVSPGTASYNFTYSYDRYGNPTCGSSPGIGCPALAYSSTTNRVTSSGWSYDGAGNLMADGTGTGSHTYQWDGEGRLSSVDSGSTNNFTYDALGQQVQFKISGNAYDNIWDVAGHVVARYDEAAGRFDTPAQFYLGDQRLGYYGGASSTYTKFVHPNALGSTMMITDQTTGVVNDTIWYPWGDFWQDVQANGQTFAASWMRRGESGLDFTLYRAYNYGYYRWLSPDPVGGDTSNPQSLNRYAYVLNNPTTLTDPLGLDTINCTIRNGCREPGGNGCTIANGCRDPGMNLSGFGGSCYIDGLPAFCNAAYALLNAGSGGTTVSSVGGFLTFQVPIPPGAVQSTFIDPITGQSVGSTPGALYPGSFETVTTDIPGFDFPTSGPGQTQSGLARAANNAAQQGQLIGALAKGLNALTTPLQNVAVSGGLFLTGAAVVGVGVGSTAYVCGQTAFLGCAAFATFGGVPAVGGGLAIIGAGWQYTRQVTLPSVLNPFR